MNKKYTNYDAVDFAEETSFIQWVRNEDAKATAFWEEWRNTHPEKSEIVREAKTLVKAIQIKEEEPSKERIKNLWGKIDAATKEEVKETTIIRPLTRRRWISYVAAACIGLIAFFYIYNPNTTVNIGNGEHLAYTLPDNSTIELNADSKITFKKRTYSKDRIVELDGEAFFDVEKGASFKVITPNGMVEVLGTSFNVNTRNGGLEVDCRTGKVRVTSKGSSQLLTEKQGTKLNIEKTALEATYTTNIAKKTGWRNGDYYFTNVPFSTVIEELERQYNVQIECEQGLKKRVGDYVFKGDLKEALKNVSFQLNVKYEVTDQKVIIK